MKIWTFMICTGVMIIISKDLLKYSLNIYLLAASPPSGRLFLLVPAESFFGPTALIINFELSYDRFAVTPQL